MMNWTVCLARHSMTTLRVVGVFSRWIDSDHVTYPPTWMGLYELLCGARKVRIAKEMKTAWVNK